MATKKLAQVKYNTKNKVFAAMSGGVDSSVAALLLKKQGYDVIGVFIRGYNVDGCQEREASDARRAAEHLKIPFYVFDFEKEYKREVVDYMVKSYKKGITPNPDVMCNKKIKFGLFLEKALEMGADYVATGHYVKLRTRVERSAVSAKNSSLNAIRYSLYASRDQNKDQSYFLWTLTQPQLKYCLFPVGDYLKSEVRKIAEKAGLPNAEKKDSQGICFLGKVSLKDFLKQYLPVKIGPVLNVNGEKIGEHEGMWFYTIGQRHIGVANRGTSRDRRGNARNKDFQPLYVCGKDIKKNALIVAEGSDNAALYKKEIYLQDVNFINPQPTTNDKQQIYVRIRYRQPLAKAALVRKQVNINLRKSAYKSASIRVLFERSQKAVAPGQSAVFYNSKDEILGGGVIE